MNLLLATPFLTSPNQLQEQGEHHLSDLNPKFNDCLVESASRALAYFRIDVNSPKLRQDFLSPCREISLTKNSFASVVSN